MPTDSTNVVVTVPEPSTTSLLSNIHNYYYSINKVSERSNTVIAFDVSDYNRIRRLSTVNKKYLYLYLSIERLRQFGKVRLINYRKLYSGRFTRRYYRKRTEELVTNLSGERQQDLMIESLKGWISYARGGYQHQVRRAIEDDLYSFMQSSKSDQDHLRQLERGGGDNQQIVDSLNKIMAKSTASLEICDALQQNSEINAIGIIAGPEYNVPRQLASNNPSNVLAEAGADDRFIFPSKNYQEKSIGLLDETRDIAHEISDLNADEEGFILGPHIGFLGPIDLDRVQFQFQEFDRKEIIEEVEEALSQLKTVEWASRSELKYGARYIFENLSMEAPKWKDSITYEISSEVADQSVGPLPLNKVQSILAGSINSLTISQKITNIKNEGDIGDGALLVAASLLLDPMYNYNRNRRFFELYHWWQGLFSSPFETDRNWLSTQTKGMESWTDDIRWYE